MKTLPPILATVLVLCLIAGPPAWAQSDHDRIAANKPVYHWTFPDRNLTAVGATREVPGPASDRYPAFDEDSRAMHFASGAHLRHPAASANPEFRFNNGETVTIEAWLRCDQIANGQNQYIIGKGRTHQAGFPKDNQNWALRLRGEHGRAKLSFLFRSADEGGKSGEYHRWTSKSGFLPGKRWHHLAVTYEFGDPTSLLAWIDGKPSRGSWDLGGATKRPPVVDSSEVWIGSSLGGSPPTTLHGAVASLALYRHAVRGLEGAFAFAPDTTARQIASAPAGRVSVEVFQADSGRKAWPEYLDDPLRTFDAECFALFRLPPTYGQAGERREQSGVYYVRLAAELQLPAGEHSLLLRAPGMAKLTIGPEEVALLGPARITRDAHGSLRDRPDLPYLRARLGTTETEFAYSSNGQSQLVVLEALVGDPGGKIQVGELLLAANHQGPSEWVLPSPAQADLPFTPAEVETYKQRERIHQENLNRVLRRELASSKSSYWQERHDQARNYIEGLAPLPVPESATKNDSAIDRFLSAKISAAAPRGAAPKSHFQSEVLPLLEEHCTRCHGDKKKGGLRLDTRGAALRGGESGPALVPHQPEKSELLTRVLSEDKDVRMPPKGERLAPEEKAALTRWIEEGAPWVESAVEVRIPPDLNEHAFLRRLYLDTVGVFPSHEELEKFFANNSPHKRARLIDQLLADPRHADHWVGYWQDVLAENPRLVKPTLNNTGPFRYWIHDALRDNKPFDRFVTELVTFEGGTYSGAAGGFRLATQNDVPMAAKAHVLGTAFLGLEMKCARCHDAPFHSFEQKDLFSVAAMLKGSALKVPKTSSVPKEFFASLDARQPRIKVTLDVNSPVQPSWPFSDLAPTHRSDPSFSSPAKQLAYQLTRPENRRFARVIVNRVWKRYFGQGFVEPAHDWEGNDPSHPELLDYLARDFVSHHYDLHRLSRLILNSAAYRRASISKPAKVAAARFFEAPLQRRLSAEQLVDSLFAATGTPFFAEELTLDVDGIYPNKNFLNMGHPRRAWELISLSTERDRPTLTLTLAQSIVSFMEAYGWRSNRAEPLTDRPSNPNVLQAGMIANSLLATWWTRLSDHSELTRLAIEAETVSALIDDLYLRLLTRQPTAAEAQALRSLLEPGFSSRHSSTTRSKFQNSPYVPGVRDISWRNHLNAEANQLAATLESKALAGPPPTTLLNPEWRTICEDAIWAILNSPEIQFVP